MISIFLISGCDVNHYYAPVSEISFIEKIPNKGYHRVLAGETLYEIAWRYGLDYRFLIWRNHLKTPYVIDGGQVIYLRNNVTNKKIQSDVSQVTSLESGVVNKWQPTQNITNVSKLRWVWPVASRSIIQSFSVFHKGINITGFSGEPIRAAAVGKVVYAGNGLRGYGNLIIIKHTHQYFSAYAHHRKILVKEGDWVTQGQKIAEMGNTGADEIMLHFEVRHAGKPVNPLMLLPH
jgi:lipoprotein NlpD